MRDVAALAGVSVKSVSRVINGGDAVSADLREKVSRAIERLDFQPNLAASSLRRSDGVTGQIALLLEDLANPFSATLNRAVEDVAHRHGTLVFAGSLEEDGNRELALVRASTLRRVDGIIIAPATRDHGYLNREVRAGTPVVFVDRAPRGLSADHVLSTNAEGARDAVLHLADNGHERIAYLGDHPSIPTAADRLRGYTGAMRDLGLAVDPRLVVQGLSATGAAAAATTALLSGDAPPTALFTSQNLVTIGAVTALQGLGRQREVAVVGFDDFPLADLLSPKVTVVAQDVPEIGATAARLLFGRIAGDDPPHRACSVPTRLVVRESGLIPPR
ncbi:LacI family DNA-binding transcriptional regulator [Actinorugispora endophytica]|nr:LacI family DNA-binding transcriptional regulator [Actinorugispora endophytica]